MHGDSGNNMHSFSFITLPLFIFTEEEISAMKQELDKYGIHMPHFGKIGGILAKEVRMYA